MKFVKAPCKPPAGMKWLTLFFSFEYKMRNGQKRTPFRVKWRLRARDERMDALIPRPYFAA